MGFMTKVTGDAFDFMVDAWDDRGSFTRTELGGVPDWADYVNVDGELFSEDEMSDEYAAFLNDAYGMVDVCGHSFDAGEVLAEMDPTAFRGEVLDWLYMRERDGDLRRVEGR